VFPRKEGSINPYLTFLFWAIAVISVIRFIGSIVFMMTHFADKRADAAGIKRMNKAQMDMARV
jgi:chitin synthase